MQRRKGLIYPIIVDEITDYPELQEIWGCGYMTAYRIMYGHRRPTHRQKQKLADYLGIPIDELWARVDPDPIPEWYAYSKPFVELTEEEKQEHLKQYQHEYYLTTTKPKRAENRRIRNEAQKVDAVSDAYPATENSEIISESDKGV